MARGIVLGADELAALRGLPAAAVMLYVLGIRPRMDAATGTVGRIGARVSWQGLREDVYEEPRRGVLAARRSIDQVRRLSGVLERAGLVRRLNQGAGRDAEALFMALPLALLSSVQNKAAKEPARKAAKVRSTDLPRQSTEESTETRQERRQESRQSSESESERKPPPPTPPATRGGEGGGGGVDLEWTPDIRAELRPAVERALRPAGDQAQTVLDELAGLVRQGAGAGRPVRNPARYAVRLVERCLAGDLLPELAPVIAAERERARAQREREAALSAPSGPVDPAAVLAARAAVRAMAQRGRVTGGR